MYPLSDISGAATTTRPAEGADEVGLLTVMLLTEEHADEVLAFLDERPAHAFPIAGLIRNNGVVSEHNRGVLYGCRDLNGRLVGVALIGHFILFESRSEAAIAALAKTAQTHKKVHMLLGEQDKVRTFWRHYREGGQSARLSFRELLLETRWPIDTREAVPGLRVARADDLDLIVPVHARTAFEGSGINPLDVDPEGFRRRCARRIENEQTWVWIQDGKLIFKAEVFTDTSDVIYMEGIDVSPEERGKGYGIRCLSQLCRSLLTRTKSVSVLVNEQSTASVAFYKRVGFKLVAYYDTIFLESE